MMERLDYTGLKLSEMELGSDDIESVMNGLGLPLSSRMVRASICPDLPPLLLHESRPGILDTSSHCSNRS